MISAIKRNSLAAGLLFVLILLPYGLSFGADQPAAKEQSSRVEYARIYVQIARINLQNALQINQRNPNTLPIAQVEILQVQVALAEQWLREAEDAAIGKVHNSAVAVSEILLKAAEADYASVVKINQVSPLSRNTLEKARLKFELAKLRVAMAKQIDATSPLAVMQFQIERLRENILELTTQQIKAVDLD
jgi:hypothetical protein